MTVLGQSALHRDAEGPSRNLVFVASHLKRRLLRYPRVDLEKARRDGSLMLALAEAAEKYAIISAVKHCMNALSRPSILHHYPEDVLAYGLRHHHPELANAAAPSLCLRESKEFIGKLPVQSVDLWLEYHERSRAAIFRRAEDYLEHMQITDYCITVKSPFQICAVCRTCLLTWFSHLQTISSIPELREELEILAAYPSNVNHTFCGSECMYASRCDHALQMAKLCREGLREIQDRPFVRDPKARDPNALKLPLVLSH